MTQEEEYLTTGEVAAIFRVTGSAVRDWVETGKLTASRTPGGQLRFRRSVVEAYLVGDAPQAATA